MAGMVCYMDATDIWALPFKLTGGGRQQSRESCPLNITEHAGSCCVLHPGRGCPVWMGNPWVVTVVTVYDIGTDPWCIFKKKEEVWDWVTPQSA